MIEVLAVLGAIVILPLLSKGKTGDSRSDSELLDALARRRDASAGKELARRRGVFIPLPPPKIDLVPQFLEDAFAATLKGVGGLVALAPVPGAGFTAAAGSELAVDLGAQLIGAARAEQDARHAEILSDFYSRPVGRVNRRARPFEGFIIAVDQATQAEVRISELEAKRLAAAGLVPNAGDLGLRSAAPINSPESIRARAEQERAALELIRENATIKLLFVPHPLGLLTELQPGGGTQVGFHLLPDLSRARAQELADDFKRAIANLERNRLPVPKELRANRGLLLGELVLERNTPGAVFFKGETLPPIPSASSPTITRDPLALLRRF